MRARRRSDGGPAAMPRPARARAGVYAMPQPRPRRSSIRGPATAATLWLAVGPAAAGGLQGIVTPAAGLVLCLALALVLALVVLYERRIARMAVVRSAALAALQAEREARAIACGRRARHASTMDGEAHARLGAVREAIGMVEDGRPGTSRRLCLNILQQSAARMAAHLERVLDYERIDQGRLTLRPVRTDAIALARAVAAPMAAAAADRRLGFAMFVPQHPFPALGVDAQRLAQALGNLVHNAVAHTASGEVRIELRYRREPQDPDAGWLSVTVHDTGPGLDAPTRERLAAAFEHVGRADGRAHDLGVALWIASRLARLMNGALTVHGEPGRGSDFVLRVPVRVHDDAPVRGALFEDLNAAFVPPAIPPGGSTRGRLLVVEDDRIVQFTLAHQLRGLGFDVECACDAEEAIEAWQRAPFPRVLTDLGLPGRDGVALIAAIREAEVLRGLDPGRIVVCTGEPGHAQRARLAGADAVVAKPADVLVLASELDPGAPRQRVAVGPAPAVPAFAWAAPASGTDVADRRG